MVSKTEPARVEIVRLIQLYSQTFMFHNLKFTAYSSHIGHNKTLNCLLI